MGGDCCLLETVSRSNDDFSRYFEGVEREKGLDFKIKFGSD